MQNNLLLILVVLTFSPILAKSQSIKEVIKKEQILKMIPRSHDLMDVTERENFSKLISEVDFIYPVLCEELLVSDDQRTQAYILAILGKSKKSREQVLPSIREYMTRHKDDVPQLDSIFTGIKTLGEIGTQEDVELLSQFLNIGFESDRVIADQSMKQIRHREKMLERNSERLKQSLKRGEMEDSGNVDKYPTKRLSTNSSQTEKTQIKAVNFWSWVLAAVALIIVILLGFYFRGKSK